MSCLQGYILSTWWHAVSTHTGCYIFYMWYTGWNLVYKVISYLHVFTYMVISCHHGDTLSTWRYLVNVLISCLHIQDNILSAFDILSRHTEWYLVSVLISCLHIQEDILSTWWYLVYTYRMISCQYDDILSIWWYLFYTNRMISCQFGDILSIWWYLVYTYRVISTGFTCAPYHIL